MLTRGPGDLVERELSETGDVLATEEMRLEEPETRFETETRFEKEMRFEGKMRFEKPEEEGARDDETRFLLANLSQDFPVQAKAYSE